VVTPELAYSPMQLLNDVQDGLWTELKMSQPMVDVMRRALQRSYLEHLKKELSPPKEAGPGPGPGPGGDEFPVFGATSKGTDFRPVARAALQDLVTRIDRILPQVTDAMTRVHLQDCKREIELILKG
jgi:hypothetical protein